jgi:DNA-binding CsgD family transcriptional regulator
MQLLERDEQTELIRTLTRECLEGRGQVLLIEGPPGSGRTALLRLAVAQAGQAGLRVMQATCSRLENDLAGGVLSQLLLSLPEPGELAECQTPSYFDFCRQILALAAETPLIIAVDDIQHADEVSRTCLRYLARRLKAARVLLVQTCLNNDGRSPSRYASELPEEPGAHRLSVAPLSQSATARLLDTRVDRTELTTELHRISGGNPALLNALVGDYDSAGEGGGKFVSESGYGQVLLELLRRSGTAKLPVAQALAVLGDHGTPEQVLELVGPDRERAAGGVARSIAEWSAAGLLQDGRFPHPAGRTAVLQELPEDEKASLNLRAAKQLSRLGEPAPVVAGHLAQAGRQAEAWAVPVLVEAAEHERMAGCCRQAASYLDLAHRSSPDPGERAGILLRLADAQWRRNPLLAARLLTPLVAAAKAGHLRPDRLPLLVRQLLWLGRHQDAAMVLGELRAADPDPALVAEIRNLDAWLTVNHPELARAAQPRPALRPASAELSAEPQVIGLPDCETWLALTASLCDLYVSGRLGGQAEWLMQSLHNLRPQGNPAWAHEVASLASLGLIHLGQPDTVLDQCAVLGRDSDSDQEPTWQALLLALRAEALLSKGDLVGAVSEARHALSLLPRKAWGVTAGLPLGTLVTAAVWSGQIEEAERHLIAAPASSMLQSRYGVYYLHARGHYNLAVDRAYAGLADFLACGNLVQLLGLDTAAPVPWRTSAAQAWLDLGNHDRARRLVREQLARLDPSGGRDRGRALLLLAALSSPERRPHLLLEAVDLFEQAGDQYEQARAMAELTYAYSGLGNSRRARTALRRARFLAESCGAAPLCEDLLAGQGGADVANGRDDESGQLTETERRVAHLAVLGYTNREIAEKLYVTPSTVEQHLTRIYRKLGIKCRKDLPADAGVTTLQHRRQSPQSEGIKRSAS